jgi:hypothetical protein
MLVQLKVHGFWRVPQNQRQELAGTFQFILVHG